MLTAAAPCKSDTTDDEEVYEDEPLIKHPLTAGSYMPNVLTQKYKVVRLKYNILFFTSKA